MIWLHKTLSNICSNQKKNYQNPIKAFGWNKVKEKR